MVNYALALQASILKRLLPLHWPERAKGPLLPLQQLEECSPSMCLGEPEGFGRQHLLPQWDKHASGTCYFYSTTLSRCVHVDPYTSNS